MAQDDMFVVMYKILAYLYECMKTGEKPASSKYGAEAMGIPQSYWDSIMRELIDHHYIAGYVVNETPVGEVVSERHAPTVTMEGVAFARENSMMARARRFLIDAKASVPFI